MAWVKGIAGGVCILLGLLWLGQGINLLPGSMMSGQPQWAIIGLVLVLFLRFRPQGLLPERRLVDREGALSVAPQTA